MLSEGNGAPKAIEAYMDEYLDKANPMGRAEHFLCWLWAEGFKVVPHTEDDMLISDQPLAVLEGDDV